MQTWAEAWVIARAVPSSCGRVTPSWLIWPN